jgi:chromosome segregation ATPase
MIALTDVKQRWQQQGGNNHEAEQALEQATAENQELNTEVVSLRQKLEALQNDFNVATESSAQGDELEGQLLQAKQEASVLQQEAAQAKSQATALQTENQKVSTELEASRAKTAELTANLEQAKALLQEAAQKD